MLSFSLAAGLAMVGSTLNHADQSRFIQPTGRNGRESRNRTLRRSHRRANDASLSPRFSTKLWPGPLASLACQERNLAPQQNSRLFDHLVRTAEQRQWHCDAECPGGLKINYQLDLGSLLHRQVGRLVSFENLATKAPNRW